MSKLLELHEMMDKLRELEYALPPGFEKCECLKEIQRTENMIENLKTAMKQLKLAEELVVNRLATARAFINIAKDSVNEKA